MVDTPLITFKAGRCELNGHKITPVPTPGYLYLYLEDDELLHICWRPRSQPATEPEIDFITVPSDATFQPLVKEQEAEEVRSPTNGRVFMLTFSSSGEKHFFWMQSKSQHKDGDANWFSQRDQKIGQIVDMILTGEQVNVDEEYEEVRGGRNEPGGGGGGAGSNGDTDMMDLDRQETGGAGADATGGDPREEGESSREGGADGGRAPGSQGQDTNALVQNFLDSLKGGPGPSSQHQSADKPYTTLSDLLTAQTTVPYINSASQQQVDNLCSFLPPEVFLSSTESADSTTTAAGQVSIEALSIEQKKEILKRVLHSPQLQQSLGSLTVALRDGGLPMIGEALKLKVENGGLIRGGSMPLGGGNAVEAFVKGVKKTVEESDQEGQEKMEE